MSAVLTSHVARRRAEILGSESARKPHPANRAVIAALRAQRLAETAAAAARRVDRKFRLIITRKLKHAAFTPHEAVVVTPRLIIFEPPRLIAPPRVVEAPSRRASWRDLCYEYCAYVRMAITVRAVCSATGVSWGAAREAIRVFRSEGLLRRIRGRRYNAMYEWVGP